MPTIDDFKRELQKALAEAEASGFQAVELSAGMLHRKVGGYPGPAHRMPVCCAAMEAGLTSADEMLPNSLKRYGASFAVRYRLPR